jgi:pimeloyl-ACP methyl ester carboxylesterase
VWRTTIEALSDERSVFVWDMIAYGQSDKPDGDVSLVSQGLLLAALVDHWGLDFPDVVAHDYGGTVCLRTHLLDGMPLSSLALIDVVALRPWGSPFFRLVADHADVFAALPSNLHEALLREYITGASGPGLRPDVLDRLAEPWLGDGQAAFYRQIAQADEQFTADVEPHFGDIDVPTLIVWGTDDKWIPVNRAHRLASVNPGSSLELIEGGGHILQEDRPTELNAILRRWLVS